MLVSLFVQSCESERCASRPAICICAVHVRKWAGLRFVNGPIWRSVLSSVAEKSLELLKNFVWKRNKPRF